MRSGERGREENAAPLLSTVSQDSLREPPLPWMVWVESKKLWRILGPAIFTRVGLTTMNVITQAFAGHIGDLELAAMTMALTVVVGFNFGLMLGMASALETLCGQAFGAKKYGMMGVYLQRSWVVVFLCALALLPMYIFATPILRWTGQSADIAALGGQAAVWFIPLHFAFAIHCPMLRFLQCQLKNSVVAAIVVAVLVLHIAVSWVFMYRLRFGLFGTAMALNAAWWLVVAGSFAYVAWGGCPQSWNGFSMEAFTDLWEFVKLSAASGVMLW